MKSVRERFEEIWPVPFGISWSMNVGCYVCNDAGRMTQETINKCVEWDARLDTFTRCQETTDVYVSLVEELVRSLDSLTSECLASDFNEHWDSYTESCNLLIRAKQIMEQKK